MPFMSFNQQVKQLTGNQSIDPNHRKSSTGVLLSRNTAGFLEDTITALFALDLSHRYPEKSHFNDMKSELSLFYHELTTHTKCHHSRITIPPVRVLYVLSYEWQNMWHNVILTACCHQHETHTSGLARVPLIVIIKFLLHIHISM